LIIKIKFNFILLALLFRKIFYKNNIHRHNSVFIIFYHNVLAKEPIRPITERVQEGKEYKQVTSKYEKPHRHEMIINLSNLVFVFTRSNCKEGIMFFFSHISKNEQHRPRDWKKKLRSKWFLKVSGYFTEISS